MAYSRIVKVGDGVTTQFTLDFTLGYLSRADVTCRVGSEVDGLGAPLYRTLNWITDGLVEVLGAPAGNGVNLVFERTVSKTAPKHDFSDGAAMIAQNFDENQLQAIMLVHEVLDGRFGTLQAALDFGGFRGINAGDPANPQDVATKAYVDSIAVLPSGNVPPPTLGNVGWFLKATAAGVWAWTQITISDVLGAAKASVLQVLAGATDDFLVTPLKLAALWKKSANVATASTLVRPSDANFGTYITLTGTFPTDAIWTEAAGITLDFFHRDGGQLNHSANLLLITGANISLNAGDFTRFKSEGGGVWRMVGGQKANGQAWVASVVDDTPDDLLYWYNFI